MLEMLLKFPRCGTHIMTRHELRTRAHLPPFSFVKLLADVGPPSVQ